MAHQNRPEYIWSWSKGMNGTLVNVGCPFRDTDWISILKKCMEQKKRILWKGIGSNYKKKIDMLRMVLNEHKIKEISKAKKRVKFKVG